MEYLGIFFNLIGALGLFLFGMKLLSEGVQRAAGEGLKGVLNLMTGNRLKAVLTGFGVTGIIQSSSATTVMVVSFVNAGLLTLVQATGVIMGANIGTTVTAWIVSLIGFSFKISAMAVPAIGIGFVMSVFKRLGDKVNNWGEGLLGFGLLFLGLEYLSTAIPRPSAEALSFLSGMEGMGILTVLIGVFAGAIFTMLIHSSSASTAIVITLAFKGVLTYEMSAAIILGCNIGTTIDAFLASIGASVNARRAAWVHILFNVAGTVWAVIFFVPFIGLVDLLVPGTPMENIAIHLAMLHTVFNTINTILLFAFIPQFAAFVSRLVKPRPGETERDIPLKYMPSSIHETPELNLITVRRETIEMAKHLRGMYSIFREALMAKPEKEAVERMDGVHAYLEQMREGLTSFLREISQQKLSEKSALEVAGLTAIVWEMKHASDTTKGLMALLARGWDKKLRLEKKLIEGLQPYTELVDEFMGFVSDRMSGKIDAIEIEVAEELENRIDASRAELRKTSRKRIESGSDVKSELLYMDIVRYIERLGDNAYAITQEMKRI